MLSTIYIKESEMYEIYPFKDNLIKIFIEAIVFFCIFILVVLMMFMVAEVSDMEETSKADPILMESGKISHLEYVVGFHPRLNLIFENNKKYTIFLNNLTTNMEIIKIGQNGNLKVKGAKSLNDIPSETYNYIWEIAENEN